MAAIFLAGIALVIRGRRLARKGAAETAAAADEDAEAPSEYDDRLDDELRELEGD